MTAYEKRHAALAAIEEAEQRLQDARLALAGLSPDGTELPAVITPTRFEAAYRGFAAHLAGGHDYYNQWTPDSQAAHRRHTRAVLEAAGFTVQERQ